MPNHLRNWPGPCDPRNTAPSPDRGACFCFRGFMHNYPAAWRYRVDISGALAPMDVFNGSHMIDFKEREPTFDRCTWELVLPGGQVIGLAKQGFDVPDAFGNTVVWDLGLDCSVCAPPMFPGATVGVLRPLPSDVLPAFVFNPPFPTVPSPVLVTPRAWDDTA